MSVEVEIKLKINSRKDIERVLEETGFVRADLVLNRILIIRQIIMILPLWMRLFVYAVRRIEQQERGVQLLHTRVQNWIIFQ